MPRSHFPPYQRGGLDYFKGQQFQWGTGFPPYRNFQEGEGLGDIFRNVMKFLLPIVAPIATETASKFVSSTADAMREGKSFGQAAKSSIAPAIGQAMESGTSQIMSGVKKFSQSGSGRRRRRAHSRAKAPRAKRARKSKSRSRKTKTHRKHKAQKGGVRHLKKRVTAARKRVYKRRHKKIISFQDFQSPSHNF